MPPKRCDVVKIEVSLIFLQHQALPTTPFPLRRRMSEAHAKTFS